MVVGMGQYPNLGVTDAFAAVSHGFEPVRRTRVTRARKRSPRHEGGSLLDRGARGAPKSLRIRCDENEWGLSFDVQLRRVRPGSRRAEDLSREIDRV